MVRRRNAKGQFVKSGSKKSSKKRKNVRYTSAGKKLIVKCRSPRTGRYTKCTGRAKKIVRRRKGHSVKCRSRKTGRLIRCR